MQSFKIATTCIICLVINTGFENNWKWRKQLNISHGAESWKDLCQVYGLDKSYIHAFSGKV